MSQYLFPENAESSHVSHAVFEMSSTSKDRLWFDCQIGAVSPWALDLLLQAWEDAPADAAAKFHRSVIRMRQAGTLRGDMFERQVLKHLDAISSHHTFSIRSLSTSVTKQWVYPGPARRFTFELPAFAGALNAAIENKEPLHLVPYNHNFPAVDSILYDPNSEVLTCIQITTRDTHPIDVSGLQKIQGSLKRKSPLESLRLSHQGKPWRFIFIVPLAIESTFGVQPFQGDTAKGEWAGKVDQYILGMEEDTIFNRPTRM